ncbi:DNA/RNA non-specific endonuclease [Mucilaginibacter boryungensis]|uniref:DNA/RNA non-specific endonuclease n=1 Tax=Mucilaginibacter boryungensis TaxID=768480 RepID=A0ABR9XLB3_9SPHI|nr:DNA/RNA non-specific endonuclease [Mucilaginibacter boryungensis]MBE9668183.1 DNA/RNA non-specific endonuclease [Mucilaginibacter boryungensis]
MRLKKLYLAMLAAMILASCSKDALIDRQPVATKPSATDAKLQTNTITQTFAETFESGTKTAYAVGNVTLSSGTWTLDDALIGNSTSDVKNGSQSVRIRNTGKLSMGFNVTTGASTVTIKHAVFGSDGSSAWQLWVSSNSGSTYTQVGSTITTSSSTLSTATFTVNLAGTLRFEVRKTSGGTNRINIDDFTVNSYDNGTGGGGTATDNSNLLLGNPSGATNSIVFPANYLMDQTYFVESYNRDQGKPNWVSWYLGSSSLGSTARQDDFRADTSLPSGWYEVGATSYSGSGFDRGHNCPSADRTSTVAANQATFLMTNMMPQAPNNNQQTWANLENYERTLVSAGDELYVVAGSYGVGGTGSNGGTTNTIDNGHITVPARTWKVIVVLTNGNNDLSRITNSTRVIAVDMPNINSINTNWTTYITTVDAIESATGYDIMSNVSSSIQSVIEARRDAGN